MEEFPLLAEYRKNQKFGDKLAFVSISLDNEKTKPALEELIANGLDWPTAYDGGGWDNSIAKLYGVQSIPQLMLIGPDGKILLTDIWSDSYGDVDKVIKAGAAYKPLVIQLTGLDNSAEGYKVRIDVDNPDSTKYQVKIEYYLGKKNAEGRIVWEDEPRYDALSADKNVFHGVFKVPSKGYDAFIMTVSVFSEFLGKEVSSDFRMRV
ncbi:MAG: hypothetical protein HRF49_05725 [bacterium]|jgi:hypothetical protein